MPVQVSLQALLLCPETGVNNYLHHQTKRSGCSGLVIIYDFGLLTSGPGLSEGSCIFHYDGPLVFEKCEIV